MPDSTQVDVVANMPRRLNFSAPSRRINSIKLADSKTQVAALETGRGNDLKNYCYLTIKNYGHMVACVWNLYVTHVTLMKIKWVFEAPFRKLKAKLLLGHL